MKAFPLTPREKQESFPCDLVEAQSMVCWKRDYKVEENGQLDGCPDGIGLDEPSRSLPTPDTL